MTALSNTPCLLARSQKKMVDDALILPKVTEHFWGFEVSPGARVMTMGSLLRVGAGLVSVAAALALIGIWFLPHITVISELFASKAIVSALLAALAVITVQVASQDTRVRVHVDTSKGELREVVQSAFNGPIVLARYGLDTVNGVEIVMSKTDASFGQVQIALPGVGRIAVGDGSAPALTPLRDRIRSACNIEPTDPPKPAVWGGPLAA